MDFQNDISRLQAVRQNLEARAVLTDAIRAFFRSHGFLEVDTPVRIPCPANEDYIDAVACAGQYLRTSPELHMKRLLGAGYERVFQLGPCFRAGERGTRHLPAFTMLEWYRSNAGYREILDDCRALVAACAESLAQTTAGAKSASPDFFAGEWEILTVEGAFSRYAAADVDALIASGQFEEVLTEKVEPHLGFDRPAVLMDYPISQAALARPRQDRPDRAERWELYIRGLEIANAYGELTDAEEQKRRFAASANLREKDGREVYPIDPDFMAALEAGLPPCGGIALGVDRLLMVFLGVDAIDDVVAFPPEPSLARGCPESITC